MGNASAKDDMEDGAAAAEDDDRPMGSDGSPGFPGRGPHSSELAPPETPRRSRSPLLFASQNPVAPLQRATDAPPLFNQLWMNDSDEPLDAPLEKVIPTLITWSHGGNDVFVEGSWDNWTSRKVLQRSGKDHSILLVLSSGIYQYKFIVDGEWRHASDLPSMTGAMGRVTNILDVNEHVSENLESISEFEPPPSPDSSYSQPFPLDEDFAKEPPAVPPQVHLTVLGTQNPEEAAATNPLRPRHVVLNHLFIEKGWASQSLVALGLSHRFQSKYVTVVLYKPTRM